MHTIRQGMIGGGETHVLDLVSALDPALFESEVLSFTDGEMVSRLAALNVPCTVIYTEKGFDYKVWGKVYDLIRKGNFDLVHAHGTRACSNSFRASKKSGLPLVYTIHGWSFHQDQGLLTRTVRELSERFLVNQSVRNVAVSESNREEGVKKLGMPNAVVIKNGINLQKFDPDRVFELSRNHFGIPEGKLLVGMIARLTVQKDPHTFLKAAAAVLKVLEHVHFVLVGGGDLEESCRQLAKELNIEASVTFAGFHTNVPAVLNILDVYCLPSLWEGLPIGILEAMAMRKAIVATPVDGTKEILTHGQTGLLFDEQDEQQLAKALLHLLENPAIRKQLGQNAQNEVRKHYSTQRVADEVGALYKDVIRA